MWQQLIRTSQIYGSECHRFTRTKPLVLTKEQVTDIAFSLRTQAVGVKCENRTQWSTALMVYLPSLSITTRQSLNFTSKAKPFWMA